MKKIYIVLTVLLGSIGANAQNVQLHYDFGENRNYMTSTIEMFKPDKWGNTFFFVDMDFSNKKAAGLSYMEIAREISMGKLPINAHVEFNGGLTNAYSFGNAYLAGLSYSKNAEDFSKGVTFIGMYKYIDMTADNKPNSFQFTMVWYWHFLDKKLSFTGFADFWKQNIFGDYIFLTEPQIWFNATENISVGGEIELSNNFAGKGFKAMPTLAAKWNF
jgi:hypothetical protein